MNNQQIKNIFKKKFNETPKKIIDSSKGYDQTVKIIHTNNNKYVLKIPQREKHIIKNQVFASKKWSKAGIPVPMVLHHTKDYLIETFVEGAPLDKAKLSNKQKRKIYFQLGKLMKKMHSIKTRGYGNFKGKTKGKYKKPEDYEKWIKNKLSESIKFIEKNKLFSKKELELLKDYIKNNVKFPKKIKPRLTHQDLCEEHILIKNKKISGIIDLADIKSDDPMSDFRRIAKEKNNKKFLPYVIKGYGKVNMKRINLHRFLLVMYNIPKVYRLRKPLRLRFFINEIKKRIK